VTFFVLITVY